LTQLSTSRKTRKIILLNIFSSSFNPIFSTIAYGDQGEMGVSRRFDGLFKGKEKSGKCVF
jgi:hypothetical protein